MSTRHITKRSTRFRVIRFILIALIISLSLGWIARGIMEGVRLVQADERAKAAAQHPTVPAGPAAPRSGTPSGRLAQSKVGAATAALHAVNSIVGAAFESDAEQEAVYSGIASVGTRQDLVDLARSSRGVVKKNLGVTHPGDRYVARGANLGYRVVSYTPSRAIIDLWSVAIVGGPARQPLASFEGTFVTVVWERGGWRLVGFRNHPVPTPAVAAAPVTAPDDFIREQSNYIGYQRVTG
jgi:hypothetical protein